MKEMRGILEEEANVFKNVERKVITFHMGPQRDKDQVSNVCVISYPKENQDT